MHFGAFIDLFIFQNMCGGFSSCFLYSKTQERKQQVWFSFFKKVLPMYQAIEIKLYAHVNGSFSTIPQWPVLDVFEKVMIPMKFIILKYYG